MKNYTVKAGDTLSAIAQREYGDFSLFTVIARQNKLANPNLIQVGQELLIPYVTYRYFASTSEDATPGLRKQITIDHYGSHDQFTEDMWAKASGVLQRPIQQGTWLLMPDIGANSGHHTVVNDESFESLAAYWYGDTDLAFVIRAANHLQPDAVANPGDLLFRPGLNLRRHIFGDTLESLCREVYEDFEIPTRVAVAAAANHIQDPGLLFSNQTVYFPS